MRLSSLSGECRTGISRLVGFALVFLFVCDVFPQEPKAKPQCTAVSVTTSLKQGESFRRSLGDLTFKIQPLQEGWGWIFFLENAAGRDFIYFVNPPLRFNSAQTLGRGYGESARESLKRGRELRFLLYQSDYDAMEPIVKNALWAYNAPRPDRVADEYFAALARVHTGLLRLRILNSDVAPDDAVRSAEFNIEFVAPTDFLFDPSLKSRSIACPPKPKP